MTFKFFQTYLDDGPAVKRLRLCRTLVGLPCKELTKINWIDTRTPRRIFLSSLLPFTVTRPVTNREMSLADESRDASLVFGKSRGEGGL